MFLCLCFLHAASTMQSSACLIFIFLVVPYFFILLFSFLKKHYFRHTALAKTILEATLTIQSLIELHAIFLLAKETFLGAEM